MSPPALEQRAFPGECFGTVQPPVEDFGMRQFPEANLDRSRPPVSLRHQPPCSRKGTRNHTPVPRHASVALKIVSRLGLLKICVATMRLSFDPTPSVDCIAPCSPASCARKPRLARRLPK